MHVSTLMKYCCSDTLRFLLREYGALAMKMQLRCRLAEPPRTLHAASHGLFAPAPAKLAMVFLYAPTILIHSGAISFLLLKHCSAGAANVHVLTKALRIVTAAVFQRAV